MPKPQGNPRLAVLNRDDSAYEYLEGICSDPTVSYGFDANSDLRASLVNYSPQGIYFETMGRGTNFNRGKDFSTRVTSPLMGKFNVSNCLAAMAATVYGLQVSPEAAVRGIATMPGVPGRMEKIDLGQPFSAIVDFAHTPNALRVAIETVRNMTEKKVIVIFGSAGLRDREKRRMMAEVASEFADISILTAEDPRTESLDGILEEMANGARAKGGQEKKTFWRVPDRGNAIKLGVRMASPGDIVMVCGKGHEQSMCFGTTEFPWDDRIAMQAALSEIMGLPGPKMPLLPTMEQI
jgi:UDP-N-acetylmuramoyl-L-alanyl-D-glutamate--2,6-diaminopimelate ligase